MKKLKFGSNVLQVSDEAKRKQNGKLRAKAARKAQVSAEVRKKARKKIMAFRTQMG